MISKTYIAGNLRRIGHLYDTARSVPQGMFYSKLAIIELCGWIEMSMDDIALRLASKRLRDPSHHKYIENEVIRRTYGFDYERHFLPMIEAIIGRHGIEQMSAKVDQSVLVPFVGALSTLKAARDQLAHQYIKGCTPAIDAPSVTSSRFPILLAGLKTIETALLSR